MIGRGRRALNAVEFLPLMMLQTVSGSLSRACACRESGNEWDLHALIPRDEMHGQGREGDQGAAFCIWVVHQGSLPKGMIESARAEVLEVLRKRMAMLVAPADRRTRCPSRS